MSNDARAAMEIPARNLPVPAHLSEAAQQALGAPFAANERDYPPFEDKDAWREQNAAGDLFLADMMRPRAENFSGSIKELREADALAYDIRPDAMADGDRHVILDIHGGALIMGGGEACKLMALGQAARFGHRVVSVDYRMPPDHPYPVGLDDCIAIYRALLRNHDASEIIVTGASAGGNLAAALILRARDEGLPLPAGAMLISPEVDLTESGDSFQANMGVDGILRASLMPANLLYADGHDLSDPYVSPLFGDFTKGFPPTLLTAGTRDLFLSNAVRMHRALRAAGIPAELHILEAAPHGAFGGGTPEEAALDVEIRLFCARLWEQR